MVALRASRPDDVPALLAIWRDAVRATHDFVSADDRAHFDGIVANDYLPNTAFVVAVDEADRPLGFMALEDGTIDSLFIAPEWHGRGIGRAFIDYARERNACLTVEVNEQNLGARRFYERFGFRVVRRSPLDGQGRTYPILHLSTDTTQE